MRPRAALSELASLARVSGRAARVYGCSRARVVRRARAVRRSGAWTYPEALAFGVLDPAMPRDQWERMYSKHRREQIQGRHGPHCLDAFTEEKLTFHRYMAALGVPSPAVYGVVGRAGGWSAASGCLARGPDEFARMLADGVPDEIVIKPVLGYMGLGVHVLRCCSDGLRDHDDRPVDPQELHARLVSDPEFDLFIVQERLRNHPELEALNPSPTLQTVRLVTFVARDGTVEILWGSLKLALAGAPADNVLSGQTGNGAAMIDLEAGTLMPLRLPGPDGVGSVEHAAIPGSGRPVAGRRVPFFEEVREVVLEAAPHLLPMRTLGWDVAITPRGPVVVEANTYWGSPGVPLGPDAHALFVGG
jgi:hypothetical protein